MQTVMRRSKICRNHVGPKPLIAVLVAGLLATSSASRMLQAEDLSHDDIRPITSPTVWADQASTSDSIPTKFRPYLFTNACYPHTPVDAEGNYSRGQEVCFAIVTSTCMYYPIDHYIGPQMFLHAKCMGSIYLLN